MEYMKIKKDDLQLLLDYLANRPFKEVFQLVKLIQEATVLPQEKQEVVNEPGKEV